MHRSGSGREAGNVGGAAGPEAVPEMGDWYARICNSGHVQYEDHLKRYGHPSKMGYKDLVPLWKGENWDPERLMKLYKGQEPNPFSR